MTTEIIASQFDKAELKGNPAFELSSGSIEALKWLAIALMTLDHINTYLFDRSLQYAFELGRIAMPIFVLVMAYNLARPGAFARGTFQRSAKRLSVFALLSCVPFIPLQGGSILPLNILFLLLLASLIAMLIEHGGRPQKLLAFTLFLGGGALVEYWWPALALAIVAWRYFKSPSIAKAFGIILLTASLWLINQNFWAMLAIPLLVIAAKFDFRIPRSKWYLFYVYYPLHLLIILGITSI